MNPTCEEIDNARLLANTLEKVAEEYPLHFNMNAWIESNTPEQHTKHLNGEHPADCGTAGCALGWAPFALGMKKKMSENWPEYAERLFGFNVMLDIDSDWFHYIFKFSNNDPVVGTEGAQAAAKRLREFIATYEQDCI